MVNYFRRSKSPTRTACKSDDIAEDGDATLMPMTAKASLSRGGSVMSSHKSVSPGKLSSRSREGQYTFEVSPLEQAKDKMAGVEEDDAEDEGNRTTLPSLLGKRVISAADERQLMSGNAFYQRVQKARVSRNPSPSHDKVAIESKTREISPEQVRVKWVNLRFQL